MNKYQDILSYIRKPSRYLGDEFNSIHKDLKSVKTKVALIFPDIYEIGMSHLGLKILYHILNKRPDIAAERVFAPDVDYECILKKRGLPLSSLESNLPLNQFHIIGFSLQYELTFTNVLNILRLGNIPLKSRERNKDCPLIIAGGSSVANPEPLADFIDVFVLGDGEEVILELVDIYQECLENKDTKKECLDRLSQLEGIYVPSLFEIIYKDNNEIDSINPQKNGYQKVKKRILRNLDSVEYPVSPIVPFTKIVHDRIDIEVARGCYRKCRFCQANRVKSPYRTRGIENIFHLVNESIKNTGYEEISLHSLNICDYKNLGFIIHHLMDGLSKEHIALSLPSLMVGFLDSEIIKNIQKVRKTGFTLVAEAGTERLRRLINKDISEDRLLKDVEEIVKAGWNSLKLYFMIGLPTEKDEDIDGIIRLCYEVLHIIKKQRGRLKNINVSISSFVPKSHTPFQWFPQHEMSLLKEKLEYLKRHLKNKRFTLKFHSVEMSFLEAVFSRGDRRLGEVLVRALNKGCHFDGWKEHFRYQKWKESFCDSEIDPRFYSNRKIDLNILLPWHHLDIGISEDFLKDEYFKVINNIDTFSLVQQNFENKTKNKLEIEPKDFFFEKSDTQNHKHKIPVQRMRIQFKKLNNMKFLSHLELMKVFYRALKRAHIDVAYTSGFHPRPRISFGMALPIGVESVCEYLDLEFSSYIEPEDFLSKLNQALPKGLEIVLAKNIPLKSHNMITEKVIYNINLKMNNVANYDSILEDYNQMITSFLSNKEIVIGREKNDSFKKISIRPLIIDMQAINMKKNSINLELILKMRESDNVRPEEVVKELNRSKKIYPEMDILSIKKVGISLKDDW
ncbi:MAG TPA: TIGR03960 family B12-binding radical SAM protein [Nitrospinota bacterium]|nr:TIGR03960 family B12-binding radical SAM protein [Nitrospinota bacterium]